MDRATVRVGRTLFAAACLTTSLTLASTGAWSADAEEFFEEQDTLTLYISGSPGGGFDNYARLLAAHMGRHLPGNPDFVPMNQPGAGGIVLANFLYEQAPRDGSVIAIIHSSAVMEAISGNPAIRFKPAEFGWLGSVTQESNVCFAWHTSGVTSIADVQENELIVGAVTSTPIEFTPRLLNEIAGTKFNIIPGYPSTHEVALAVERGEVNGMCHGYNAVRSTMVDALRENKIDILVQVGATKHPELPDVPFVYDMVSDPDDIALLDYEVGRFLFGRPFLTPPGVPADRLKMLRDAFWATMHDPEFLEDAARQRIDVQPVDGETVGAHIEMLQATSAEVLERSAEINR